MKNSSLVRMSFSIEEELFLELESLVTESGYGNRSEYIRDMIRKQLTRKQCADCGEVIGTISVLCDLKHLGTESKLTALLDGTELEILGMTRFAVKDNCSTTMISVTGVGSEIRQLVNEIRRLKGVVQAEFVITAKGKTV